MRRRRHRRSRPDRPRRRSERAAGRGPATLRRHPLPRCRTRLVPAARGGGRRVEGRRDPPAGRPRHRLARAGRRSPGAAPTSCRSPTNRRRCPSCSVRRWRYERRTSGLARRRSGDARAQPLSCVPSITGRDGPRGGRGDRPALDARGQRHQGHRSHRQDPEPSFKAPSRAKATPSAPRHASASTTRWPPANKPSATATSTSWSSMLGGWSGNAAPTNSCAPSSPVPSSWSRYATVPPPPASHPSSCSSWSRRFRSRASNSAASPDAAPTTKPPR